MNAYIYAADLWCEDCARAIMGGQAEAGKLPADPDDEGSFDSDDCPKGPYLAGGKGYMDAVRGLNVPPTYFT